MNSALIAFMIAATGLLGSVTSQGTPHCIVQNTIPLKADIQGDKAFLEEGVKEHNLRRKEHGVPPLTLNEQLCKSAQVISISNLGKDTLLHATEIFKGVTMNCGENLYRNSTTGAPLTVTAADVVKAWYGEVKDYNWETEISKNTEPVGYFTQVVWKGTREMCMTFSKNSGDKQSIYVTAHYFPPGNEPGKNKENVIPIKDPKTTPPPTTLVTGGSTATTQPLFNLAAACAAFLAVLIPTSQC